MEGYFAENPYFLVDVVEEELAFVRAVTAVGVGFEREDADSPNVGGGVPSGVRALPKPVTALVVFGGVEGVEAVEGIRPGSDVAGEALAFEETAGSDEAVGGSGGEFGMGVAVVGEPGECGGLADAVNCAVRDHRAGPDFVVIGIVFDQHEFVGVPDRIAVGNEVNSGIGGGPLGWAVEGVDRAGRPRDKQVIPRCGGWVGEFADADAELPDRGPFVVGGGHRGDRFHPVGGEPHPKRVDVSRTDGLGDGRVVVRERAVKGGHPGGGRDREAVERAEAPVVQVVVIFDHDVPIAELGHKMERGGLFERTDERPPIPPVGVDRPDAPVALVAQALAFVGAEHDAPVGERGGVERTADGHGGDGGDVGAVVVHDEQLEGGEGVAFGREEAVAVADKDDFAAGERGRAEVEDAVAQAVVAGGRVHGVGFVPVARAGVGGEFLEGELFDLPRGEVDAEDVRARVGEVAALVVQVFGEDVVEVAVIDPLPIEGDERVGHCAVAARDQDFFRAIRVEEHEVGAGFDASGVEDFGPDHVVVVAVARLADVDEVVGDGEAGGGGGWRRGGDGRAGWVAFPG